METSIFHVTGGLGKHVLFSSVINSYKAQNPEKEIIVVCAYPLVYKCNPNVKESHDLSRLQYFYQNYIYNKDVEIFAQDPYKQNSHLLKQKHLIETWCELCKTNPTHPPTLHFNFRELETAAQLMQPHRNKPILIFQPFGGLQTQMSYSWARDIPPMIAQEIVNKLCEKYNIIHICNPNHPRLDNCLRVEERIDNMILFALLLHSDVRILNDSCLQHASHALNLPSLVFWNVTDPNIFGYKMHNNITPDNPNLQGTISSYLFDYEISGLVHECPYSSPEEIYSKQTIDNALIPFVNK